MLVLSRKEGQHIRIGKDIRISIVAIKGNKVRVGITGPEDIAIVREELLLARGETSGKRISRIANGNGVHAKTIGTGEGLNGHGANGAQASRTSYRPRDPLAIRPELPPERGAEMTD